MPAPPTHEAQVQFLLRIQRLLNEGSFTATYKYALLLSLADIAVEGGDDSGGVLVVSVSLIAEKYIAYYWRHAALRSATERPQRYSAAEYGSTGGYRQRGR